MVPAKSPFEFVVQIDVPTKLSNVGKNVFILVSVVDVSTFLVFVLICSLKSAVTSPSTAIVKSVRVCCQFAITRCSYDLVKIVCCSFDDFVEAENEDELVSA